MTYRTFITLVIASCMLFLSILLLSFFILSHQKKQLQDSQLRLLEIEKKQEVLVQQENKVSSLLNLPPLLLSEDNTQSEDIESQLNQGFLKALAYLAQDNRYKKVLELTNQFLDSALVKEFAQQRRIELVRQGDLKIFIRKKAAVFAELRILASENSILLEDYTTNSEQSFSLKDLKLLVLTLEGVYDNFIRIQEKLESSWSDIYKLLTKEDVNRRLNDKKISYRVGYHKISFYNKKSQIKAELREEKLRFFFNGSQVTGLANFEQQLQSFLENYNPLEDKQRYLQNSQGFLQTRLDQQPIKNALERAQLQLLPPEYKENYIYYHVVDSNNRIQGSFALQKSDGRIYILDKNGLQLRSLDTFLENTAFDYTQSSKPIEKYTLDASQRQIFLLVGTHNQLADSILLVLSDHRSRKNTVLSLPRDLYFKNKKINSYFRDAGIEKLVEILSDIIGVEISYYITIDMYAFVEIVDLLGGLEVEIKSPLVDPTYRTRINGHWQSLDLPAGRQRLTGLQVLSFSRSRHTSSDFDRSQRQQQVINALMQRFKSLKISDIGSLLSLTKTLQKYIVTDLSVSQIGRLWLKVRNYQFEQAGTIDSTNLLYSTYTNLLNLTLEEQEQLDEEFFKGAFILLPKNNDWSLISNYIEQIWDKS